MLPLYCKGYVKPRYPIHLSGDADFGDLAGLLPSTKQRFIVIDEKVLDLFPNIANKLGIHGAHIFPVKATEHAKSLDGLIDLFDKIFALRPNRDDILVAIGGGAVMNLGGLAATLIMRGIRFYYVPTTLTGQIDASIGSKQGVNFKGAKNWIGTYSDPDFCYVNPNLLKTISRREFNSQAVEGVKLCLATNKVLFEEVFDGLDSLYDDSIDRRLDFIRRMIEAKLAVVDQDLLEENYGMSMLYGHTIGHAIEMLDHESISHGEGVGLGMLAAARISVMLGLADEQLVAIHKEILARLGLPQNIPAHLAPASIIDMLSYNKKNYDGRIRFVLLNSIGKMASANGEYFTVVPDEVILAAIEKGY